MRSTFKVLFYVKKGSAKPNGNLPLMCRLTVDGPTLDLYVERSDTCFGNGIQYRNERRYVRIG